MTSKANLPSTRFNSTGKLIRFAPNVEPQIAVLKRAAKAGYYYPMLALKQLQSLSAGPCGKHNVFIPNINDSRAHTFQMFNMYLPGIKATIERRSNDTYTVTSLELDPLAYQQIGRGQNKPGIYAVSKLGAEVNVTYRSNGLVTPQDNRVVIVSAPGSPSPQKAAEDIFPRLRSMDAGQAARMESFDLMFSALDGGMLGKRNYDPKSIVQTFSAASVLAKAMASSNKKQGIFWVSDFDGSIVLTQAMHILAQQNIQLPKHTVMLYKPTTSPGQAIHLIHQLGFKTNGSLVKAGGPIAYIRAMVSNRYRVRNSGDPYGWKDYAGDSAKGGLMVVGVTGATLSLATLAYGSVGLLGAGAVVTGTISAAHLLWTTGKDWFQKPKNK